MRYGQEAGVRMVCHRLRGAAEPSRLLLGHQAAVHGGAFAGGAGGLPVGRSQLVAVGGGDRGHRGFESEGGGVFAEVLTHILVFDGFGF